LPFFVTLGTVRIDPGVKAVLPASITAEQSIVLWARNEDGPTEVKDRSRSALSFRYTREAAAEMSEEVKLIHRSRKFIENVAGTPSSAQRGTFSAALVTMALSE
jgi:hypothetical protein